MNNDNDSNDNNDNKDKRKICNKNSLPRFLGVRDRSQA